jgi:hypothetical protein
MTIYDNERHDSFVREKPFSGTPIVTWPTRSSWMLLTATDWMFRSLPSETKRAVQYRSFNSFQAGRVGGLAKHIPRDEFQTSVFTYDVKLAVSDVMQLS